MNMATVLVGSRTSRDRRPQIAAGLVSLLLHALLVWSLLWTPWSRDLPQEPQTMVIEVVPPPMPVPRAAPPPPPLPPPPDPSLRLVPPPPPPQLNEAPIAERSTPPPAPRPSPQPARPRTDSTALTPGPRSAPALPRAATGESVPLEGGRFQPGGAPREATATQAVQDFILAQIARHWIIDLRGARFGNVVLSGRFVLLPDGMLAPPFGRNDPWDLRTMVRDYETLMRPGNETMRTAIETFLQAARLAQPFRMPPDGKADEPRVLPLSFRLGDL